MEYIEVKSFIVALVFVFSILGTAQSDLVINYVERTLDLSTQTAKYTTKIKFHNPGKKVEKSFLLALEKDQEKHLSYLEILDKQDDSSLEYAAENVEGQSGRFLKVSFSKPLRENDDTTLHIETVFTHVLTPFPAKIGQTEKQLVLYKGNTVFYSPYEIKEQSTTVKLASSAIESYSRLKPSRSSENTITYGPYKNSKPYRLHEMKIHFENNSPFLVVNEMTRWIEISHWGNIAVEETYHMTHEGALLKGHFSRYDYQRSPTHSVIKSFKTVLPAAARDVYYRDEIGNISTSNMLVNDDSVEIELRPRFPLFGGWKTKYMLGYNVPAYQYLYNKGDNYILKMRLIDHVFDEFVIDNLNVKIILPEGSTNIEVVKPYELEEGKRDIHKTYLDTSGRTVIVLSKKNVVENHIQDIQVHYTFKKLQLLQEPVICVAVFYILFLSVIILVRLDFSITKDAAKESRMKVASLLEELLSSCGRRGSIYYTYDTAIDKLKQNRNQNDFAVSLKKLNQDYNTLTQSINELCSLLIKEDPEIGDKVNDLQKKENERKVIVDQLVTLATRVVTNKIGRQQYIESEKNSMAKREKLGEDIDNVLATL